MTSEPIRRSRLIGPTGPAASIGVERARLGSIDAFRYVAFLAVVLIHSLPIRVHDAVWVDLVDQAARFAVPFFFIAGGYFLPRTQGSGWSLVAKLLKRLMPIFLLWLVVYSVLVGRPFGDMIRPMSLAHDLITGGPAYHLWFLPALGISLAALILLRPAGPTLLVGTAVAVHGIALAWGPYRDVLGLPQAVMGMRNGPFFGLAYVTIGHQLALRSRSPSPGASIALLMAGLGLQLLESRLVSGGLRIPFDFTIGTLLLGTGVFCLALQARWMGDVPVMSHLGRLVIWMYCVHAAFLMYVPGLGAHDLPSTLWTASVVIVLSTLSALIAAQLPILRPVVT